MSWRAWGGGAYTDDGDTQLQASIYIYIHIHMFIYQLHSLFKSGSMPCGQVIPYRHFPQAPQQCQISPCQEKPDAAGNSVLDVVSGSAMEGDFGSLEWGEGGAEKEGKRQSEPCFSYGALR